MSLDVGIHSDSSLVSLYSSQITLYKSLYVHQGLILKSIIQETSYSDFLSIITGVETSCILSEKELDVAGSSMDI